MKTSQIPNYLAVAGIVAAGVAAYFVVKRLQAGATGLADAVGDAVDDVYEGAKGVVATLGEKYASAQQAHDKARDSLVDGVLNVGANIYTGQGISFKPGGYKTTAQRAELTGGSMLLTDAEKAAIRAADSGKTPSRIDVFSEVGELKRAENRDSIYSIFN